MPMFSIETYGFLRNRLLRVIIQRFYEKTSHFYQRGV